MKKVVIAGGSGFIGDALTDLFTKKGYEVAVLSRSGKAPQGARGVLWNGKDPGDWTKELEGAAGVINLAGSPISQKWSNPVQDEIVASRVLSTKAIGEALENTVNRPPVWLNGSAVGYYGNRGDTELTEASDPGPKGHFLVDTAVAWEAIHDEYAIPGLRRAKLRIGLPLGLKGGVFPPFLNLTKFFLGGHHGSGDQFFSWIHVDDLTQATLEILEGDLDGPIHLTAPNPVSNRYFMAALRGVVGRPWSPPVPAFALEVANWFGAPDPSLLLEGQKVLPTKLTQSGFQFRFPEVREAFIDLVKKDRVN